MGCPEKRFGQRLSLFKTTLLDTKTQSSNQKKIKSKKHTQRSEYTVEVCSVCLAGQRIERVLWRTCHPEDQIRLFLMF